MSLAIACNAESCTFTERDVGSVFSELKVSRVNLLAESARQVRVNSDYELVNTDNMKRRDKRRLNWAYAVDYTVEPPRDKGGEVKTKTVVFGNFGIGRKRSRKNANRVALYVNGDVNSLNLKEGRSVSEWGEGARVRKICGGSTERTTPSLIFRLSSLSVAQC